MSIPRKALIGFILSLCLCSHAQAVLSRNQVNDLSSLSLNSLKEKIHILLKHNHNSLGYDRAKKTIFEKLDNHQGLVCGVYSNNNCLRTSKVPSHKVMNVEHTWPQSLGAKGTAKSDLHHLFPTVSRINSTRSNFPFCQVEEVKWQGKGSKMGRDKSGAICFEPPHDHKGNVARAMFYFAIRYKYEIDTVQERVLRIWHHEDPVDADELQRHKRIVDFQRNTNVFIENPELVDQITDF